MNGSLEPNLSFGGCWPIFKGFCCEFLGRLYYHHSISAPIEVRDCMGSGLEYQSRLGLDFVFTLGGVEHSPQQKHPVCESSE